MHPHIPSPTPWVPLLLKASQEIALSLPFSSKATSKSKPLNADAEPRGNLGTFTGRWGPTGGRGPQRSASVLWKRARAAWAGGQWVRATAVYRCAVLGGAPRPLGVGRLFQATALPAVLPTLGQRGLGVNVGGDVRGAPGPSAHHSHLQDHDDVGFFFESVHTLDQLGVVKAVHDADLLPDILFLFCRICLEEFPCPDFSSFLLYKSKDLSKFPTANERRRREKAN